MKNSEELTKGFVRENPVFVMLLGMCPTLGVTTSAMNGLGMGLATLFVLVLSNFVVSLVKNIIPDKVRIPSFIVIIASFVTIVDLLMAGYSPSVHEQLGLFIPLIVVNCLILGRAEAKASKSSLLVSILDGIGMGLGFTFALVALGAVREILGSGSIFNYMFLSEDSNTILLFVMPPGAFLALAYITLIVNKVRKCD